MRRLPSGAALAVLLGACALAVAVSLVVGPVKLGDLKWEIVVEYRLPRAVLALLVGASLAASGATFQGLFRNELADPFVMGVSGGAALGAVGAVVLGIEAALGPAGPTALAFVGGLAAAFAAYRAAGVRGRVPLAGLVLSGFAIGSFCGALVSILVLSNNKNWNEVIGWLMGNMGRPDPWDRALVVAPCLAAAGAVMAWHARDLNLLLLGEESARQLGVEVEPVKRRLLAAGAIAAAGAVATCGMIGFVGLIVPNLVRRLVGPDHRALLPATLLAGGALLTLADVAARAVPGDAPVPIGAATAILGAPFFIALVRRRASRA